MAEIINAGYMKKQLVPVLQGLLDSVAEAADKSGAALVCAALFGSAAARDFAPGRSDINVFLVFDAVTIDLLRALRPVFAKHVKKLRATPVVTDTRWIGASAGSFPMEFLEWKERSLVFYGENPLDKLEVPAADMPVLIGQALRGKRLRLVQAYLELPPGRGKLQPLLMSSVPGLVVICRNIMRMQGAAVLSETHSMLGALERKCGAELSTLKRLLRLRGENIKAGTRESEIMLKELAAELDALADYVRSLNS